MCRLPPPPPRPFEDGTVGRLVDDDGADGDKEEGDDGRGAHPEAKGCRSPPRITGHVARVTLSTLTFWTLVAIIPLYNKHFFQKKYFPRPIATAGMQTGLVGSTLFLYSVARHCVARWTDRRNGAGGSSPAARRPGPEPAAEPSWVLGPHLLWKLRTVLPVGALFGLKYGITNVGLHMVPAPIHLLLQSTDLVWTVLWASLINREKASSFGLVCLSGCLLGTALLSKRVLKGESTGTPALAVLFNLVTPILLGLVVAHLRAACVELQRPDNRVGGTVSSAEITSLKLLVSSGVALTIAAVFEPDWRAVFRSLPLSTRLGVMGSAIPILFYQVNCTYLASLTSAVAVGLVGQLKVIPQWTAAVMFSPEHHFDLGARSNLGSYVTLASTAAYAVHNWIDFLEASRRGAEGEGGEGEGREARTGSGDGVEDDVEEEDDVPPTDESAGLLGKEPSTASSSPRASGYRSTDVV